MISGEARSAFWYQVLLWPLYKCPCLTYRDTPTVTDKMADWTRSLKVEIWNLKLEGLYVLLALNLFDWRISSAANQYKGKNRSRLDKIDECLYVTDNSLILVLFLSQDCLSLSSDSCSSYCVEYWINQELVSLCTLAWVTFSDNYSFLLSRESVGESVGWSAFRRSASYLYILTIYTTAS